jgi:hypothetical protein
MIGEEVRMDAVLVEVVGSENGRDDGDVGIQLDPHQPVDDGLGDELVAVDTSIDDEPGADHGGIVTAPGQTLGVEGDLECPGHPEKVDPAPVHPELGDLRQEGVPAAIDDVLVPFRLHEGEPFPLVDRTMVWVHSDSLPCRRWCVRDYRGSVPGSRPAAHRTGT